MYVGGEYVGLGLGDNSNEIRAIKAYMRRMFASYAGDLADTAAFDEPMVAAVSEMQVRLARAGKLTAGRYTPGIINKATKEAMGYLKPEIVDDRGVLLTACGTGVPWWVGPDADVAREVADVRGRYKWRPIAYRAAAIPMGPSIDEGVAEGIRIIFEERARIERWGLNLAGFSQGAIVMVLIWMEINRRPDLAWCLPHVQRAVMFGNPMREPGKVWPDAGGALPDPRSGGIAEVLMANTPSWWRNYAHKGDLYTDVMPGQAAENKIAIFKLIMGQRVFSGPDSILRQILELLGIVRDAPRIIEITALFQAIFNAGMFFGKRTGPHLNYSTREAIDYLLT